MEHVSKLVELRSVYVKNLEQNQQQLKNTEAQLNQLKTRGLQLQGAVSALDDAVGLLSTPEVKRPKKGDKNESSEED